MLVRAAGDLPQTALVTGASGAIGGAVARTFAERGMGVALHAFRNTDRVEALALELRAEFAVEAVVVQADLAVAEEVDAAVAAAIEALGSLGVVVAAGAERQDGLLWAQDPSVWVRMIDVNLVGTYHLCRAVVPGMLSARAGRIVVLVSPAALYGNRGQSAYAASKAGAIALVKSLAQEVGRRGVTVNAVSPGFVASGITADVPDESVERLVGHSALQRLILPEEVAAAVADLAANPAITGQVLSVDGGVGL